MDSSARSFTEVGWLLLASSIAANVSQLGPCATFFKPFSDQPLALPVAKEFGAGLGLSKECVEYAAGQDAYNLEGN